MSECEHLWIINMHGLNCCIECINCRVGIIGAYDRLCDKLAAEQATIAAMREALQEAHLGLKACEVYMYDGIIDQALSNTAGAEYSRVKKLEQVADDACAIMDELARGDAPSEAAYEALRESIDLVGWDADNKGNDQTQRLRKMEEAARSLVAVYSTPAEEFAHYGDYETQVLDKVKDLQAVLGEGKQ
ncbi:hypothetical protein EV210_101210 [Anaerospora hongkongensis]|uniref:Uncharacterized protein n=1 Tax=Anaerospora hongkongensis TaxID=244830 RepID=A0A4R1Q242_9FIRM|nr:hypothetical protein [Anaerospora hongkongensis]TCL40010.1 hypothetical protein EV210_101210 [Anaerospora hongkongensis]